MSGCDGRIKNLPTFHVLASQELVERIICATAYAKDQAGCLTFVEPGLWRYTEPTTGQNYHGVEMGDFVFWIEDSGVYIQIDGSESPNVLTIPRHTWPHKLDPSVFAQTGDHRP